MRAIQVYEVGGPEVLQEAEVDQPRPGPGEAVVEVAASGVNFLDVYHREGRYSLPLPFTLGAEGAGTVVEVGPGVADVAVGDRVGWVEIPGTYAERAVVDSSRLVPLPDDIGFETAAAVLLQGMTAHYLVKDAYPVRGRHGARACGCWWHGAAFDPAHHPSRRQGDRHDVDHGEGRAGEACRGR